MQTQIKVGDKVFYNSPRSTDRKNDFGLENPELTVIHIYDNGSMADVKHDNGHIYLGYLVSRMWKQ